MLFAHGWISSRRMWYDVVDRLDGGEFAVQMLDFRGCGLSDRPREGHDLDGYAGDLRAALASIDGPVTLVAHSMGAKLAQLIAAERPANLERMILVAPGTAKALAISGKASRPDARRLRLPRADRAVPARGHGPPARCAELCGVSSTMRSSRSTSIGSAGTIADAESTFMDRLSEIDLPDPGDCGRQGPARFTAASTRDCAGAIAGALFV